MFRVNQLVIGLALGTCVGWPFHVCRTILRAQYYTAAPYKKFRGAVAPRKLFLDGRGFAYVLAWVP
jgi:hypothetical protein